MTWLLGILGALVAAAGAVLGWRTLRKTAPEITPKVVDLAEKRAGAIAEAKEAEARARDSFVTSAGELADAQKRGESSGLTSTLESLGAKRK